MTRSSFSRSLSSIAAAIALVAPARDVRARPRAEHPRTADAEDADAGDGADAADAEPGDGPEARAMLPIHLDDVIDVAVRLAPDLQRARVDRVAAVRAAQAEARSQAWVVSSDVQYARRGLAEHVDPGPFGVITTTGLTGTLALERRLPTGGAVALATDLSYQEQAAADALGQLAQSSASGGASLVDSSQARVRATLMQPLARGFGPTVALAPQKRAALAATEATVKAQLAAEQMVRDLVTAYWELAYAAFEVDVRTLALRLAHDQDEVTRQQRRAGTVAANAVDAVTYELAVREEALLRAQLELERRSLELRRTSGLELERRDVVLRPAEPFELGEDEFDVDEVRGLARETNHQLAAVLLEQKIADLDVAVAADQARPQVDLSFSGGLVGQGTDTGAALAGVGATDGYEVTVGLRLSFELSGAARRGRDAAVARRRRLDVDREDLERQLDEAVVTAAKTVTAARTRAALADRAIDVAEDNVRAERASFMAGRTTNFTVMQRQGELIEARLRRGRAVADYHQAVAQLQFLSGVLLDQYRVDVRPQVDR